MADLPQPPDRRGRGPFCAGASASDSISEKKVLDRPTPENIEKSNKPKNSLPGPIV